MLSPLDRASDRLRRGSGNDREIAATRAPVDRRDAAPGTYAGMVVRASVAHVEHQPTRWAFEAVRGGAMDREPVAAHAEAREAS